MSIDRLFAVLFNFFVVVVVAVLWKFNIIFLLPTKHENDDNPQHGILQGAHNSVCPKCLHGVKVT